VTRYIMALVGSVGLSGAVAKAATNAGLSPVDIGAAVLGVLCLFGLILETGEQ
jgi:hypothetical protein